MALPNWPLTGPPALQGGDRWMEVIQAAVLGCTVFVAMCSREYATDASPWTTREFLLADENGKHIVPLWHSGTYPPPKLALSLGGVNYVPKASGLPHEASGGGGGGREADLRELLAAIQKLGALQTKREQQTQKFKKLQERMAAQDALIADFMAKY